MTGTNFHGHKPVRAIEVPLIRPTLHKTELKRRLTGLQSCQYITINKIVDTLANETAAEVMNQPGSGYSTTLQEVKDIIKKTHQ